MNPIEKNFSACAAGWKTRSIQQRALPRVLGLILGLASIHFVLADQPLSVCALPSFSTGGNTLLLDPVARVPVALLSDPNARPSPSSQPVVLQTVWSNDASAGLPRLRLVDALPDFWAQPASLSPFLKGPGAYSGRDREIRARDWAGMQATDRRAYRLDPGLRPAPTATSFTPRGGGAVTVQSVPNSLRLGWLGVAGRIYQLQFAVGASGPFGSVQTLITDRDGAVQINLSLNGPQGFYRLAEILP